VNDGRRGRIHIAQPQQADCHTALVPIFVKNAKNFLRKSSSWLLAVVVIGSFFSGCSKSEFLGLAKREAEDPPAWMAEQIRQDLAYFRKKSFSQDQIDAFFRSPKGAELRLARCKIKKNKFSYEALPISDEGYGRRLKMMAQAFTLVCNELPMPDVDFLIALHDSIDFEADVPLFVMAKSKNLQRQILIPDFDAVRGKFQVIKKKDLTTYCLPWEGKKNQLIWRGSTAQRPIEITPGNFVLTRIILCELSQAFPELIDAKFTLFCQIYDPALLLSLQRFKGEFLSYADLLHYKYQLLIDGNTCAYTNSGWKLFTNSVIFKPDSDNIQWYYNCLKPYEHFIPVKADLSDLREKVQWAREHDQEAAVIASNARAFACQHLKTTDSLMYLYYVLHEYSKLN
jgi:Glycosyl transferase family 90